MGNVIPYNKDLVEKAREYRNNPTLAEHYIWKNLLRNSQLLGYKFTRQKPLTKFIVDFYCSKLLLVIEIDGEYHNFEKVRDEERTNILNSYNIEVVRLQNNIVLNKLDGVKVKLIEIIRKRENELGITPSVPLDRGK